MLNITTSASNFLCKRMEGRRSSKDHVVNMTSQARVRALCSNIVRCSSGHLVRKRITLFSSVAESTGEYVSSGQHIELPLKYSTEPGMPFERDAA